MAPLTDAEIHRALRALDAGEPPSVDTIRQALLMALALRASEAEIAQWRALLGIDPMARPPATPPCRN
jgi:hypothetical protein